MARKRRSLDEQLSRQGEQPAAAAAPKSEDKTPAPQTATAPKPSTRAAARIGKKAISGFYEKPVAKQLKMLAVEEDRTTQSMLGEALNLLFEKYGKDAIASED